MHRSATWARKGVLAAVIALALGLAACGDDDDGGDSAARGDSVGQSSANGSRAGGGDAAGGSSGTGDGTSREAAVEQTLEDLQEEYVEGEGDSYCDRLTAAGRKQVEQFGKAYLLGNSCVEVINTASKRTREAGVDQKPTRLISVEFKGDRAIATVRDGNRPREKLVFVNVEGDWKLPDPGFNRSFGEDENEQQPADPEKVKEQIRKQLDARQGGKGGGR